MHSRSVLTIFASLLATAGGCTTTTYSTVPYYYDTYGWPVVDYGYYVDTAMWYDSYYYYYYPYSSNSQSNATAAGTPSAPGAQPDGGTAIPFPRPLGGLLAAWGVAVKADCAPVTEWTDDDQDGVPAEYDALFNCVDQTVNDRTSSVSGSATITDTDDNNKLASFTVKFTNFTVATTIGGNVRTRTLNGSATLTPMDGGGFRSETNLNIAFDFADAGATRTQGTYAGMTQAMYTPDPSAGSDVFASGSVALSGSGTLNRTFQNTSETRQVTRTTNPPLHWNRSCRSQNPNSPGYDSGTLLFQDDKGSKVQLQFNGCGGPTITTG